MSDFKPDRAITPFGECLLAIAACKYQIEAALRTFKRHSGNEESTSVVANHLIVLVCSFREEFRRFGSFGRLDPAVQESARIAKPALERIDRWPGIRVLRNSLVAHSRDKDGGLLDVWKLAETGTIPFAYMETALLGECAVYAAAVALCRHDAERTIAYAILSEGRPDVRDSGIHTIEEFDEAITEIRRQIVELDPALDAAFGSFRGFRG